MRLSIVIYQLVLKGEMINNKLLILIGTKDTFSNNEIEFLKSFGEISYSYSYEHSVILTELKNGEPPKELVDFLFAKYTEHQDLEILERVLEIKNKFKINNWFTLIKYIHLEKDYVDGVNNEHFLKALDNLEDELKQF